MKNKYEIKCSMILAILYGEKNINVNGVARDGELSPNTVKKYLPEIRDDLREAYGFWKVYKGIKSQVEANYENYAYSKIMEKKAGKYDMEGK